MENKNESKEGKRKFALWIRESTMEKVRHWFEPDNCSSQSEFIEKAVLFYVGFLASEGAGDYVPRIIVSTLQGIVNESSNRISRDQLDKLRDMCVNQVKKTNGSYSFQDAYDLQKAGK